MKVYKFGGASVRDARGIKNLTSIVSREESPLLIVVSALGKTTNALEKMFKNGILIKLAGKMISIIFILIIRPYPVIFSPPATL